MQQQLLDLYAAVDPATAAELHTTHVPLLEHQWSQDLVRLRRECISAHASKYVAVGESCPGEFPSILLRQINATTQ